MPQGDAAAGTRLNGWKEIAAHFGKGVRTVQRWEAELGMPVHRMGTGRGEAIYALASELDAWQRTIEVLKAERSLAPPAAESPPVVEPPADPPSSLAIGTPSDTATPRESPAARTPRRTLGTLALAVFATAAVIAVAGWAVSRWALPVGPPASGRVADGVLKIYDSRGNELWTKEFDFRLTDNAYETQREAGQDPAVVHDIDGDGEVEVLFVSEPWMPRTQGLFCFNADGSPRFNHVPDQVVRFGPNTYAPPWRTVGVYVTGVNGKPHDIWFVATHQLEFPTVVEKLDPAGNRRAQYWSNGQVTSVSVNEIAGRPVLLVGATSNEFKGGSLAVLDRLRPSGAAPAVDDHYRCEGCPPASPLTFLVFPPLDVTTVLEEHSHVSNVVVDELGQILANVTHHVGEDLPEELGKASSLYHLDQQFRVARAELGERVPAVHRWLERRKLLDHPFSAERDGQALWPVRRWNGRVLEEIWRPETGRRP